MFGVTIPFIDDLGVEYISAAHGVAVVALTLQTRHLNSWAVAHGGVLMSMLDVAMAGAGRTVFTDAGSAVTIEMKTTFLQPGNQGSRLTTTGRAFHHSTTMAFCEGEVRDEHDRLIARAMGTFKYLAAKAKKS